MRLFYRELIVITALLSLVLIHLFALITPGPDFFFVSQTAISRSKKETFYAVGGITVAVMFWALLALLGLNILFEKMVWLKQILLIGGGLYLGWLGFQLLKSAFSKQVQVKQEVDLPQQPIKFFIKGLLTNLSNPKALIYFSSIFSIFLANPALDHVHWLLFILVVVETAIWFLFVSFVFSLPTCKAAYQRSVRWIDGISGGIFTLFGVFLLANSNK